MSSVYALRLKSMANKCLTAKSFTANFAPKRPKSGPDLAFGQSCDYELIGKIGEGSYGTVYKAVDMSSGRVVAIKRIINRMTNDSMIRNEVDLLSRIRHKNIIELIDKFDSEDVIAVRDRNQSISASNQTLSQYLVFEFCDFDLRQILYEFRIEFTFGEIKNILQQILEGIDYIHDKQVIHRDIKPENILINQCGRVRIADFGFAQSFHKYSPNGFPSKVVTLAYRAPELLVDYPFYGTAIDMWSVGCLMAELWSREGPLMAGADEYQQIILISRLCGPINSRSVLGVNDIYFTTDLYLPQHYRRKVKQKFVLKCCEDTNAVDLFDRLLCLNIFKRISAKNALNHSFFSTDPQICDISTKFKAITDCNNQMNFNF